MAASRNGWFLAPALVLGLAAPAAASSLLVEATGISGDRGTARLAVYSSRVSFPDSPRHVDELPVGSGALRWQVHDLPTGDYAVLVWHDRDNDGELARSMFGAPQEPYGYSNAVRGNRPDWDEVRVALGPDPLTLRIQVD